MNKFIKNVIVVLALLLCTEEVFSQTDYITVRAKVLSDRDSLAVGFVNVAVDSMNLRTSTNDNGFFSLKLPDRNRSYKILLSKVGFKTSVFLLDLRLEENPTFYLPLADNVLQEVEVSTGYQSIPKERATGSFEVVDTDLFNRQVGADIISRLDGIMPSVLFDKRSGGESDMIVRGVGTFGGTAAQAPLIVVDNFPFEGDIRSINPQDVKNVVLLKDAAAASIWGAKAGNGVLVITTKRGGLEMPWKLAITSNHTFVEKPDLFYQKKMSSAEFINVEQFLYGEGAFDNVLGNTINRPVVTPVIELLYQHENGQISDQQLKSKLDVLGAKDLRDDLSRYFYRLGYNQQHGITLSGGGTKSHTFLSLGYDVNRSNAVGDENSRVNLNLQNTFQPLRSLDISVGLKYANMTQKNNSMQNLQMTVVRPLYPYATLVGENGQALSVARDYRASYIETLGDTPLLDWHYRPYDEIQFADNSGIVRNMVFSSRVKYGMAQGLSAEMNYQLEYQPSSMRNHYSIDTYYTRNLINQFTVLDGDVTERAIPLGGILDRSSTDLTAHAARTQINYDNVWGKHALTTIVGAEVRQTKSSFTQHRLYGYDEQTLTSNIVNYVDRLRQFDNLASPAVIPNLNGEAGTVQRFVSFYGNSSYTYDERYILSFSIRRDASNLFGVKTNNKWTPLWSAGGAWNIGNEQFYRFSLLPVLKLRTTYGYSGNVKPNALAITTLDYRGVSRIGRFPYAIVLNAPNPELRWEKLATFNLGLDFGSAHNIINGSIEYYCKTSTDLLAPVNANTTIGFSSLTMNSAKIRNEGLDFSLNGFAKIGNVDWLSSLLLSINHNTIVRYLRENDRPSQWVGQGQRVESRVGHPAYSINSYKWGGLDPEDGSPRAYLNGEKSKDYSLIYREATFDDLVFHGSALPVYYGAFRNTWRWNKGLEISANFTYKAGYFFRRNTINYSEILNPSGYVGHGDFAHRWQNPGDELKTDVPAMAYPVNTYRDDIYKDSEATVEKGNHIRLQDINLSYILNDKNWGFKQVKISFYARNLGILWRSNAYRLDPDVRQLPLVRSYAIGLTANF